MATPNFIPKYDGSGNLVDTNVNLPIYQDSNNNIGLGTISPQYPFHIMAQCVGIQPNTGAWPLVIQQSNSSETSFYNGGQIRLTILANGYIGIATQIPAVELDVNGIILARNQIRAVGGGAELDLYADSDGAKISSPGTSKIKFLINDETRMTLLNTGYFGLGTISPSCQLDIFGYDHTVIQALTGLAYKRCCLKLGNTTVKTTFGVSASGGDLATAAHYDDVVIRTETTSQRLFLNTGTGMGLVINDGNIGVGLVSPIARLDVNGAIQTVSNPSLEVSPIGNSTATNVTLNVQGETAQPGQTGKREFLATFGLTSKHGQSVAWVPNTANDARGKCALYSAVVGSTDGAGNYSGDIWGINTMVKLESGSQTETNGYCAMGIEIDVLNLLEDRTQFRDGPGEVNGIIVTGGIDCYRCTAAYAITGFAKFQYGLYMGSDLIYGIYQNNPATLNYFAGSVGVGTVTPPSKLHVEGSFGLKVTTVYDNYNASDETVILVGTGTALIYLPPASTVTGRVYYIKKITSEAGTITIDGNGSETIDGAQSQYLTTQFQGMQIVCDGTAWSILAVK
jgi:hypothetical protein